MRILITGGAGFIGSCYSRMLSQNLFNTVPTKVTILDSLTYAGNRKNIAEIESDSRLTFIEGSILDVALLKKIIPGHDLIINFAAETHVDNSIKNPRVFFETNTIGAQNIFELSLKARIPKVIQVSTDEVYGSIESGSWDEYAPVVPSSPYSASKASADLIALAYHKTYNLNVSITRCSNNYGPYQNLEKLIPLFITNLLSNKPLPLYGDGNNIREWIHVEDHCRGIELISRVGNPGEIYNIGTEDLVTNLELTFLLLKNFGLDQSYITRVPDRPGHDARYALNSSKIKKLGFTPIFRLSTELPNLINWYRNNKKWWNSKNKD